METDDHSVPWLIATGPLQSTVVWKCDGLIYAVDIFDCMDAEWDSLILPDGEPSIDFDLGLISFKNIPERCGETIKRY
jgi:hypothetical protein